MSTEMNARHLAATRTRATDYILVTSPDSDRFTVMSLDPKDPWAAIEAMRAHVQRLQMSNPKFDLIEAPEALGYAAEVIDLTARRAG